MKNKFECRVCIDLFAGAGRALLRSSKRIVEASPFQALGVPDPFDRYIFCELDAEKLAALEQRASRKYPVRDVKYVRGDSNENVETILSHIPQ